LSWVNGMGYTWDIHGMYMGYDMNRMGEWVFMEEAIRSVWGIITHSPFYFYGQSVGAANRVSQPRPIVRGNQVLVDEHHFWASFMGQWPIFDDNFEHWNSGEFNGVDNEHRIWVVANDGNF
jgi:hypothetical protein